MNVLVINSGSSSLKFQLIATADEAVLAAGVAERIGAPDGTVSCVMRPGTAAETTLRAEVAGGDHHGAMLVIGDLLTAPGRGVVRGTADIDAVGHRVVHGGDDFRESTVIDAAVETVIEKNIPLAPLHNPANLDGIRVARSLFADAVQVAVFDTAFHQTIPDRAHIYALPYEFYERHRVRRYGFHGTSHKFVAGECAALLGKPLSACNLITVHLGNGCSITAIEKGRSVDTSLGMTPLEGLVMGTRCGDIDPAIHAYLHRAVGLGLEDIDRILNGESGLKGICGMNDMRDIHRAIAAGDDLARLALEVQTYRIRKYIGAYLAVLGSVDALVFTGGIGENDSIVRTRSVACLAPFGLDLDPVRNDEFCDGPALISTASSKTKIWVIPTNEELAIARETLTVLSGERSDDETGDHE